MRPFNPDPITDRSRELFGEYMRRYETPPSMSAFDAPISDRQRELYGVHRSRYSRLKVGQHAYNLFMPANGTNWVTVGPWSVGGDGDLAPTIHDIAIYQVLMSYGGWAGNGIWRMLVDGVKVYPFLDEELIDNGSTMYLGTLSTTVRTGEVCEIQFKSDNAADGAGVNMSVTQVLYGELQEK